MAGINKSKGSIVKKHREKNLENINSKSENTTKHPNTYYDGIKDYINDEDLDTGQSTNNTSIWKHNAWHFNQNYNYSSDDTSDAKKTFNVKVPLEYSDGNLKVKHEKHGDVGPERNRLFKYASYTNLFTLSALNVSDISNSDVLLSSANPHDIIVRSGGIGESVRETGADNLATQMGIVGRSGQLAKDALKRSRDTLSEGLDMYFSNVTINSIPPMNQDRRLTAVTKVTMEIIEPLGISLLDKIRGAASNCGFLDHVDAPYLLTIDFKGFDEHGNHIPGMESEQRRIPIKITNITLNVNAGSTVYNLTAVAYNEFAFMNRYNYLRTSGDIKSGNSLATTFKHFETLLNKKNIEDTVQNEYAELPDKYQITVDPMFGNAMPDPSAMEIKDFFMGPPKRHNPRQSKKAVVRKSDAVITILTALMKTLPQFQDNLALEEFRKKVERSINSKNTQPETFYFDYFAIDSNVVPMPDKWDNVRGTHPKIIKIHVYPHRIHAYAVAQPGVSTGTNFNPLVKKEYNYIFTGDNIDILNLDIDYKVAYYQTKLQDIEGQGEKANLEDSEENKEEAISAEKNVFIDPPFIYKTEPGVIKTVNGGILNKSSKLDQLFDAISNPTADMVNIRMEIIGDPAWIGQVQYLPANPATPSTTLPGQSGGSATDIGKLKRSGSRDKNTRSIWNEIFGNFNINYGEPLIKLNFRTPRDFDAQTGQYEMATDGSLAFSGLYRVVGCVSTFADGKFTQELNLVRCKSQGKLPYTPGTTKVWKPTPHIDFGNMTVKQFKDYGNLLNKTKDFYVDKIVKDFLNKKIGKK